MRAIPLYRIFSLSLIKKLACASPFFGQMTQDEFSLFKSMLDATNEKFLRWGIDKALSWENPSVDGSIVHIHGDKDLLFPVKRINNPKIIKGGTHFMIVQKPKEISDAINHELMKNKLA